ncbi:MAG TPA: UDP-N-acetylmuramate--L-alanine ligase [Candidatus Gemmiger stercorigallinarum]|nr:UDP-N-acetylmuramate--L-alanine ligase [Candidatus Gemmiger stercorigallinarum]
MAYYNSYDPKLLDGVKRIHCIGCGGSGMFPLIQILHARGYALTGSDVEETKITQAERAMGMTVTLGHDAANLGDAQLVVYSAAIHDVNPELQAAHAHGIRTVERAALLGYVSRLYPHSVGVAGTHGKTTTTGMIVTMLELAGKDPAAVIGGKLPLIGGYGKVGGGDSIVVEACEYSETFLYLTSYLGIILNIDNDHLEYYGTMGKLKLAFQKFALLSRTVVFNLDDPNTLDVMNSIDRPVLSFGIENDARFRAVNIREYRPGFYEFDVEELGEHFAHLRLNVPGYHNIYNALAMCCCVRPLGLQPADAERAAENFKGMGRRFEVKGECNGAVIVDDYAHHPTELAATLKTARSLGYQRVIAVHQPFTYSRTKALMQDFADVLRSADQVVLLPVMGSREVDDGSVRSEDLAAKIPGSVVVDGLDAAADWVKAHAGKGDLVVCMSCGDLYKAADKMVEQ